MKRKRNNGTGNLRVYAAAGIFALALFMPVLLCGCKDTSDEDALLLSFDEETHVQMSCTEKEETMQDVGQSEETEQVYVYVCGAVNCPGVYQAQAGVRLFELIEMAGGFMPEADRSHLNLARTVADGEQIVVLTREEIAQGMTAVSENSAARTGADNGLVNINTASVSELTGVSGIGESRAQAIIDYREKNGAFKSVEEIKKVDGIKDGLVAKIKDYIKV